MKGFFLCCCLALVLVVTAGAAIVGCSSGSQAAALSTTATAAGATTVSTGPSVPTKSQGIQGPLRVSSVNPRYFTDDSGRAVYLSGSHTWLNLQDGVLTDPPPAFDYNRWLHFLKDHNHNFFRLWTWEQAKWYVGWPEPLYFTPQPYERTGPGAALDGKLKFDLTKFNQAYFDRLRGRVIAAGQQGIYVSVMLFNGWSVSKQKGDFALANPWRGHPFNSANNINGVNGDPNGDESGEEIQQLPSWNPTSLPAYTAYQEAYVKKVIDTIGDLDNVLYEIANETNGGQEAVNWQYHMIDFIHRYERSRPKQHPVGMTAAWPGGNNADLLASPAEWISPNSPTGTLDYPPIADGTKVVVSDTDHLVGLGGNRVWAWKAFMRGENLLFMDRYDDSFHLLDDGYDLNNPNDSSLRLNLGYIRVFADRMDLLAMKPHGELSSSGYALANPSPAEPEYLVYLPSKKAVTVDLTAATGTLSVEWFDPSTGSTRSGAAATGGAKRLFSSPFGEDSVLYIRAFRDDPPTTTTANPSPVFTDITPSHPYYAAVMDLANRQVVSGYGNAFGPDDPVARQQFAKMIVKSMAFTVTGEEICPFVDVEQRIGTDPLYPDKYVAVCAQHGITKGKDALHFAPYEEISGQQLITMVSRAAEIPDPPEPYVPPFTPSHFYPEEHYLNARKAAYIGLLEGLVGWGTDYNFLRPATRGEVAQLLHNLMTLMRPPPDFTSTTVPPVTTER